MKKARWTRTVVLYMSQHYSNTVYYNFKNIKLHELIDVSCNIRLGYTSINKYLCVKSITLPCIYVLYTCTSL